MFCSHFLWLNAQADHMVVPVLVHWGSVILFSTVAALVHSTAQSAHTSPFSHLLANLFVLPDNNHSNRCAVIAHHVFDLHFPDDQWCWASFHVPVGYLYVFFGKMSNRILCAFFKSDFVEVALSCMSFNIPKLSTLPRDELEKTMPWWNFSGF